MASSTLGAQAPTRSCDIAVIGGGLLGSAFGWGLARRGQVCQVFDEGDTAVRTARGNFGLVWVQGKGLGMGRYARWSLQASRLWRGFADELEAATGLDLAYSRGGLRFAHSEQDLQATVNNLKQIQSDMVEEAYQFETLEHSALKKRLPLVGDIAGATFCEHDGHCNPLMLLRALHQDMQRLGATYRPNTKVERIEPLAGGGYRLLDGQGERLCEAEKLVIAAGHGSRALAEQSGIELPIHADQGQVIVTEKVASAFSYTSDIIRQTDNGSFLLGASSRDVGMDTRTDLSTLGQIARECVQVFPFLRQLRMQRAWGAVRVMTPDGFPVYQHSKSYPGVFSFACHSGVTLAACHALEAAQWVIDGAIPSDFDDFHPKRFHVQASI